MVLMLEIRIQKPELPHPYDNTMFPTASLYSAVSPAPSSHDFEGFNMGSGTIMSTQTYYIEGSKSKKKASKKDKTSSKKKTIDEASTSENDVTLKKRLLSKLFRLLTLKATESTSSKARAAEEKRRAIRRHSRQSSTPSNFEPMPTIYEENESDLLCDEQSSFHKSPSMLISAY
uniref:Dishevelled C-terminal domain-containing protein n=1 Tax=Panagrellus redivivus TaxID=6233 RepID=A0A7E4UWI9_PANRE